jgi:hypothetical protein
MARAVEYGNFSLPKGIDVVKYIFQKEHWPKEGKHILAQSSLPTLLFYSISIQFKVLLRVDT